MNLDGREFAWEDVIENDGPDFILLTDGDYDFEVVGFERARHSGSEKLPACNKAIVSIRIQSAEGATTIKHNLFLHSIMEGKLCNFFTGIGQRKKGEKVTMNWSQVVGSKGRAKVGIQKWTSNDGREMQANEIKRFYDPDETADFEVGRF